MAFLIFPTVNDIGGTGEGNKLSESNVRDVFQRLSILGGGNRFLSGFLTPASSANLVLLIPLGEALMDGYHINSNSAVNVTLAASATNYVWLQYAIDASLNVSSATIVANTSATPPARSMLICTGVTNATAITSTSDKRNFGVVKVGPEATPAWPSAWRVVDMGNESAFFEDASGQTGIANNAYTTDGTNWLYRATGAASRTRYLSDGSQEFSTAPSAGGGGTAATFTGAGFIQAGTGAVIRTAQDKSRESVSVLDFGVNTTPGTTDMYPAFLAAYNSGANRIYIPRGNYLLSQTWVIDRGVTVYGESMGANRDMNPADTSVLTYTGTGACISYTGSDGNGSRGFHLRDIAIRGSPNGLYGVLIGDHATGFAVAGSVINVQIRDFTPAGGCGIYVKRALDFTFRNILSFLNYDGIRITGLSTTLTFDACWCTGNTRYGYFINGDLVTAVFRTCIAESSGKEGLYIIGKVSNCDFYSWHSESNNTNTAAPAGSAPVTITASGGFAPIWINFYAGHFGDYVGASYKVFSLSGVSRVGWHNVTMQSFAPGFMEVDATTADCNFTTPFYNIVFHTHITGNSAGQVTINNGVLRGYRGKGNTGSIATATATKIFTADVIGMYNIVARLVEGAGSPATYMATARVLFDGSATGAVILANNGANLTITLSGNDVQVTQSSGGTGFVRWSNTYQYLD